MAGGDLLRVIGRCGMNDILEELGVYNSLVTRCGSCHDPFLTSTMVRIAESAASDPKCLKECQSAQHL